MFVWVSGILNMQVKLFSLSITVRISYFNHMNFLHFSCSVHEIISYPVPWVSAKVYLVLHVIVHVSIQV